VFQIEQSNKSWSYVRMF